MSKSSFCCLFPIPLLNTLYAYYISLPLNKDTTTNCIQFEYFFGIQLTSDTMYPFRCTFSSIYIQFGIKKTLKRSIPIIIPRCKKSNRQETITFQQTPIYAPFYRLVFLIYRNNLQYDFVHSEVF